MNIAIFLRFVVALGEIALYDARGRCALNSEYGGSKNCFGCLHSVGHYSGRLWFTFKPNLKETNIHCIYPLKSGVTEEKTGAIHVHVWKQLAVDDED